MAQFEALVAGIVAEIVNPLLYLFFGIAIIVFLWGIVQFIFNFDSEEARSKGKRHMLWGVIGIFIMVSAFGVMCVLAHTVGASHGVTSKIPFC